MLISKRGFVKTALGTVLFISQSLPSLAKAITLKTTAKISTGEKTMPFTLPELPYEQNALEPHISANTLGFHHGKHHNAYVVNLNKLIDGTGLAKKSLEEIIKATAGDKGKAGIFNNAAQVWNHTFYWHSMKPSGGGKPDGALAKKIDEDLGGLEEFKTKFKEAGATQFGSGWAWLVLNSKGKLEITKTLNAENPMTNGSTPLLTMDVWEHAYYLDFQNRRPDYIDTFLNFLVNWEFAAENLEKAKNSQAA